MTKPVTQSPLPVIKIIAAALLISVILGIVVFLGIIFTGRSAEESAADRGQTAYLAGDYAAALAAFSRALNDDPQNSDLHIMRGLSLMSLEAYDEAQRDFEQALALSDDDDTDPRLYVQLGYIALEQGTYDQAIRYLTQAHARGVDDARLYLARAQAHYQMQAYQAALDDLAQARQLAPDNAALYRLLGDVYFAMEQPTDARDAYEVYLTLTDEPQAYVNERLAGLR